MVSKGQATKVLKPYLKKDILLIINYCYYILIHNYLII